MLRGLRTVGFAVADLSAAKAWYAELLGFAPYFDQPFYVGFEVGGYELGLMPAEGEPRGAGSDTAYWSVDDVAASLARLEDLGARLEQGATDVGGGIVVGSVIDPFGNRLGVIQNPHFRPPDPPEVPPGQGPVTVVPAGARFSTGEISDRILVKEVEVAAPPGTVWRAWTTANGLAAWLSPARMELRVGGPFEIRFLEDAPPGAQGSEGCRVLSFVPGRMLSFTWNAPPSLPKTRGQRTWVVVDLEPAGAGTRVRLSHTGWPSEGLADPESDWPQTFDYFDRAWDGALKSLADTLEP